MSGRASSKSGGGGAHLQGEEAPGMTGLVVEERGHVMVVAFVVAKSPAEKAAVGVGDHLVSVNGKETYGLTFQEVKPMLVGPAGTMVEFVFKVPETGAFYHANIPRVAGSVVQDVWVSLDDHAQTAASEDPSRKTGLSSKAPTLLNATTNAPQSARVGSVPRQDKTPVRRVAPEGLEAEEVFPERLGRDEKGEASSEYNGPESSVVGWHVKARVGLRVSLIEDLLKRGPGIVAGINESRGYVAVRWSNGHESRCVYTGGGGVFSIRAEAGQLLEVEEKRPEAPLAQLEHIYLSFLTDAQLASTGSEGKILGDVDEARALEMLLPIAKALDHTVKICAHMEAQHAHQGYTMLATVRGETAESVDEALDLIAESLGEQLFAIHRPPRPEER